VVPWVQEENILLVGMMGPEQGKTLLCELKKPLPHSEGLLGSTAAASDTRFSPE